MPTKPKAIRPPRRSRPATKASRAPLRGHDATPGAGHAQALSRGLALLEALAQTEGGATLTAVSERISLPTPTAHRLLATLEQAGYVQQGDGGEWLIGVRAFQVGSAFLDHRNLFAQAYPHLKRLMESSGETTNLAVINDDEAVFVAQVQCRELMRMISKLGARAPLHASGVGKAMLAAMPAAAAQVLIDRSGLERHTARTLTDAKQLAAELAVTRERGYSFDDEEHADGLRCVAAVIWNENGEPWAAVSIAGPTSRLPLERIEKLGQLVRSVAADITAALGGHPPRC